MPAPAICAGLCLGAAIALAPSAGAAPAADQDETRQAAEKTRDAGSRAAALSGGADAAIRREVLQRLETDPHVNVADLEVVVQDGIITLHGRVATHAEKHIAARGADDVRGSQGVVNAIEVVPGLRKTVPPGERPAGVEQEREIGPAGLEDDFRVGPEPGTERRR
jgi:hypothetical protein